MEGICKWGFIADKKNTKKTDNHIYKYINIFFIFTQVYIFMEIIGNTFYLLQLNQRTSNSSEHQWLF